MRVDSIQALRALAAYLVLFYHIHIVELNMISAHGGSEAPLFGGLIANGYIGVDLFFVISGFIMVYATARHPAAQNMVRDFFLARLLRIYPTWWLFCGATAFYYFFIAFGVPFDSEKLNQTGADAWYHITASFLLLPQTNLPILMVGWTLVHEVFFYIVFGIMLLAPRRFLPYLLVAWGLVTVLGSVSGLSGPHASNVVQLAFSPLSLEFIAGALAGCFFVSGHRHFPKLILSSGLVTFFAVAYLMPSPNAFTMEWGRVLFATIPCVALVYGAAGLVSRESNIITKILSKMGDWSYSLYLSHLLILASMERALPLIANALQTVGLPNGLTKLLLVGSPGVLDNLVFAILAILAATIVAAIAYYGFEKPVLTFLNKRFRK